MIKNRLSKELLEELNKKKEEGKKYKELAVEFNIPASTIIYNLDEEYREKKKKVQREYQRGYYTKKKFTPEQKKLRNEYSKAYFKNRYSEDPEFRKKHLTRVKDYAKRKREEKK